MIKAALIGCGRISPLHIVSIKRIKEAELAAVCDIKEERAENTAKEHNCKYYTDYKEMLLKERPDVVHICTPHHLHHEMTVFAAELGIHVITEKPMSISYEEAKSMVKSCKSNNVTLSVMFQNRFNRAVRFLRKEMLNGNLGKPLAARVIVTWNRSDEYYSHSGWKGTWDKEGGGVVIDQAIHSLDLVRYITGKKPLKVEANILNRRHNSIEVEDMAEGVIECEDNFTVSFYTMNYFTCDLPIDITFHCEKGIASILGDEGIILYEDGRRTSIPLLEEDKIDYGNNIKKYWGYYHFIEIKNIYENIQNNSSVEVSGEDALITQELINAIYQSGKTKEKVTLTLGK
ncbi:Gfo/Idh/MocA family protein [Clostridium polynesiense]|uniref:Gfo/Idh/MocA family protein n=1 Tax=Clostridium polynesiense TaxID=1325933 RepID=UPI00058FB658|nr:Gfo/Idh/MocA family oxidoreductase [Clostridium polynesiense]